MIGLFFIFIVRAAYFKVLKVSSKYAAEGEMHAIIKAFDEPPKESINSMVNFESLYGIYGILFFLSESPEITF